jgi:hypothetical protein
MANIQAQPLKERLIAYSRAITDAWEVTIAYAGRVAEWVLFGCMMMNIIEILPGVHITDAASNVILGVQAITLDIGGLGLYTIAKHASDQGDEKAARRASITSYCLIGLMIVTVLLVAVGTLYPTAKSTTDQIGTWLILARVVMTVVYSFIMHSLHQYGQELPVRRDQLEEREARFNEHIQAITERHNEQIRSLETKMTEQNEYQICSVQAMITEQIRAVTEKTEQKIRSVEQRLTERFTEQIHVTSEQDRTFTANTTEHIQASFHDLFQPMLDTLEQHKTTLARVEQKLQEERIPNTEKQMPPNVRYFAPKSEHRKGPNESPNTEFDKGDFVRSCLTEIPNIRNAEIQRRAEEMGQKISPAYISEIRKSFFGNDSPAVNE